MAWNPDAYDPVDVERFEDLVQVVQEITILADEIGADDQANASFDCGYLKAAAALVETMIPPDFQALVKWHQEYSNRRLLNAIKATKKT